MRPIVALLLILALTASGLLIVEPVGSQISPAVPEFSLKLEDQSYDVVPTYTSDPHTENTVVATGGYHVEKRFIDVVIKNPFAPSFYAVVNSSIVKLYYNIRVKGHLDQNWRTDVNSTNNLAPSDANYTTVKYGFGPDKTGGYNIWLGNLAVGSQVDFQVQGVDGFYTNTTSQNAPCWRNTTLSAFSETGRSAWSATQTITITEASASPTSSPAQTPTPTALTPIGSIENGINSNIPIIIVIAAAIIALLAAALIFLKKQ